MEVEKISCFWKGITELILATETVNGWMNSPGHRINILTPHFQSEGIGVSISGNQVYLTQNFC
jgi:uncharacterized protein YkwD